MNALVLEPVTCDPRQLQLYTKDPELHDAIKRAVAVFDIRGERTHPILLFKHAYAKCRKLKLAYWDSHQLVEGPMQRGRRQKRPPTFQLFADSVTRPMGQGTPHDPDDHGGTPHD